MPSKRWRQSEAVAELRREIINSSGVDRLRRSRSGIVDDLSFEQLRTLQSQPKQLRLFIANVVETHHNTEGEVTGDLFTGCYDSHSEKVQGATNSIVQDIEDTVMTGIRSDIANEIYDRVDRTLTMTRAINNSPKSRRRFLANLAGRVESRSQIQKLLQERGLSDGDANRIAATLSRMENRGAGLEKFVDASKSPQSMERAQKLLKNNLKSTVSRLEKLKEQTFNDQHNPYHRGRALLEDGDYAGARRAVFEELGIDPALADGPDGDEGDGGPLEELVAERVADAESDANAESWVNWSLKNAALVGAGTLSGGAVYFGTAAASQVPSLARASHDASTAETAHRLGLADSEHVAETRAKRDAAYVSAALDVALAGVNASGAYKEMTEELPDVVPAAAETLGNEGASRLSEEADRVLRKALAD